ncbi:MAG: DUF2789 domain-containing protein [Rubrivivax sp.]
MDTPFHRLCDLFAQLGLPHAPAEVEHFIATHRLAGTRLCDAPFWSVAQAQFLREQLHADADWAEVVDDLAVRLAG